MLYVLGSVRTGLIFTGLQEGAQPGAGGWPHLAEQSPVFHTLWRHAGFRWGGRLGENPLAARERAAQVRSERVGLLLSCFLLICIVVVPVFPLFAVLLNCPYPDPPVFCLFSFHSPPHRGGGEGGSRGAFVAGGSWN